MLLPGLLAWVSTVGSPIAERGVALFPRVTGALALIAMVAGPLVSSFHQKLGRIIGVVATMGLCLLTWLLLGPTIGVPHLEPVRAAIGAMAWLLFAFGWGAVREPGHVPEEDPRAIPGPPLAARNRLPKGALVIISIGMAGAAIPMFAAWRVIRPSHALLAHAAAIVCAIALVTGAAKIAVDRQGFRPPSSAGARLGAAVRPLTLLAVVLILRFIWMLLQ